MIRAAGWGICALLVLCCAAARAQQFVYPAYPAPAPTGFPAYSYGNLGYGGGGSALGYGGVGYGVFGYAGLGYGGLGFGGWGFGARGYYPPNPYGNMNWLPPNPPSPYYVTPRPWQYLEQVRRADRSRYAEIMLRQGIQQ